MGSTKGTCNTLFSCNVVKFQQCCTGHVQPWDFVLLLVPEVHESPYLLYMQDVLPDAIPVCLVSANGS